MRKLFKERKLFKGGNYMRKYGRYVEERRCDLVRPLFKGGNYSRKYGKLNTVFPHIASSLE